MNTPPRFLCDEMLGRLCRYLRAAGYDALFARNGSSDAELLQQCKDEGRHFLTQDTLIREHKAARGIALILPRGNLDQLAAIVKEQFKLDWLNHAFTRCLVDNSTLMLADDTALARAPADALRPNEPLFCCPTCRRIYWRGSHYKRMHAKLVAWQTTRADRATLTAIQV
ncbi:MAG: Mut7-C RNAse domain-containing protein [Gammaproteobacteria bacterium]|nr:Mut7-C RNAse domain-containing protein [Gammaproteobacteria bacterium]MDD2929347.1 Mut7-C RNAse domain-containing protein [Sideroxydans sp.]